MSKKQKTQLTSFTRYVVPWHVCAARPLFSPILPFRNVKSKENKTILVVDDNEQALTLVKEALLTRGFNVVTFSHGADALALLDTKKGESADLVIIDLVMPDVDGMDLAGKILAKRPDIKILVMSGYADDVVVHGIFERKGVDFLGKPFSIRDLFTKVSVLLAQGT